MVRAICLLLVGLLFLAAGPTTPARAQGGDRTNVIAREDVAAGATTVTFDLSDPDHKVKAIRLVARDGKAVIARVVVTYANGQVHYEDRLDDQERPKPIDLKPGERTAEIDPRQIARVLARVEVVLRDPAAAPMRLELWARQPPQGLERVAKSESEIAEPKATPRSGGKKKKKGGRAYSRRSEPAKAYSEVDLFFGTNRRPEAPRKLGESTLEAFGTQPDSKLWLGKATVTVPKEGRQKGQLNRPEYDLIVTSIALRDQDPAKDFTLLSVGRLGRGDFIAQARVGLAKAEAFRGQALVFVHGYNVSFDDALFRAAQITYDMDFDGLSLVYSWPSLGGIQGYFLDQRRARAARDTLKEFLDLVAAETGASQVHLVAHSMGANPILEALQAYPAGQAGGGPRFSEVILAAPDVLREDFERIADRIRGQARGITLYASKNDKALRISGWSTLGQSPAGFVPASGTPVIAPGVDTIDVSALNTSFFGLNHSTFADRDTLIGDIRTLIMDAVRREPAARLPAYVAVPVASGRYWRYVAPR